MKIERVEIYTDGPITVGLPVIRHPARQFPGVLIQGDTLKGLHSELCEVLENDGSKLSENSRVDLEHVRDVLSGCLEGYKVALARHGIDLPFVE